MFDANCDNGTMQPATFALVMSLLAVPFAAWAALLAVAAQAPEGFEDQAGFHFGVLWGGADAIPGWMAWEI